MAAPFRGFRNAADAVRDKPVPVFIVLTEHEGNTNYHIVHQVVMHELPRLIDSITAFLNSVGEVQGGSGDAVP